MAFKSGADYAQVHAAAETDKPHLKRTWVKANPSLSHMPHLEAAIRADSKRAKVDDSAMQSFRALRLNQGVADVGRAVILDANTWRALETDSLPAPKGKPIWGIDLGSGAAMSAVASYEPLSGRLEVVAAFPSIPSLAERGAKDAVSDMYEKMFKRGELVTTSGRVVNVAELIEIAVSAFGTPDKVCCDRWRQSELEDALDAARANKRPYHRARHGFQGRRR